jgi:hypothetical protein
MQRRYTALCHHRHSSQLLLEYVFNDDITVAPPFGYSICAARAFCDCPAIISHRPRSQNILKEPQLNPEEDSRIKRPRSHVSLEKSS